VFIELQIAVPKIISNLQNGIAFKVAQQKGLGFTAGGTQYVVQDVQLPALPSILPPVAEEVFVFYRGYTVHPDGSDIWADTIHVAASVKFRQDVTYQLMAGMSDAGSFDLVLVLSLRIDMLSGTAQPQMTLGLDGVSGPDGADPAIAAALQTLLGTAAPAVVSTLSVPFEVSNAGVAIDPSGSRIALRMQLSWGNEQYTLGMWNLFYSGASIADHLNLCGQTGGLSVFLPGDLVAGMVQQSIEAGLAQHTNKFNVQGGVVPNWAPTPACGAHVDVTFNGDVSTPDLLPSIHVDVSVGVDVSVAQSPPDTLQIHGHVDYSVNAFDKFILILLAGLLGRLGGYEVAGPIGAAIGLMAGIVAASLTFTIYQPDLSTSTCTQSGSDVSCTQTFLLPTDPTTNQAVLTFNSVVGAPEGMVIFSALEVGGLKIQTVTVRTFLRSINFNFANGLRSLGPSVINAQYIGSN
jgi:hypothetical protein